MELDVKFAGINFKNLLVVSAGTPTINPENIKKCIANGAGGICTKSISLQPETWGLPRPANFFADRYGDPGGLATIELAFWSPEQAESYIKEIKPLALKENCKIMANIACEEVGDELKDLAKRMQDAGADLIEAASPCPILMPPEDIGKWYRANLLKVVELLKKAASIPVSPKIASAFLTNEDIRRLEDAGVDGIHDIAGATGVAIDIETGKPLIPSSAPYFGRGLRPLGCQTASLAFKRTKTPILSSGGMATSRDAIERLMCGATLAGICTAVIHKGYRVIGEIIHGMEGFFERKGYKYVKDIIGISASHIDNREEFSAFISQRQVVKENLLTAVDPSRCTGCERCCVCLYGAMTMEGRFARVDLNLCQRCGVCQSLCPTEAISITARMS